jgi:SagB-type dehydrogenase family enzyme
VSGISDTRAPLVATIRLTSVTGAETPSDADPTEDYHEASRLYPGVTDPYVVGAARLERSIAMRITASRSVRRHPQRPFLPLPAPDLGGATLAEAVAARRSHRTFRASPLTPGDLATLLHAGYGVTGTVDGTTQELRTAPSGGALYPLELYAACHRIEGLDLALYHYDPLRHGLELVRPLGAPLGGELTPYGEVLAESAAVLAVTAMFWRSRFKYGDRAYRFTLIEAGHVAQNVLLAASALRLAAAPVGGFYDRAVDAVLGVDGLYEASLYLVPVGHGAG